MRAGMRSVGLLLVAMMASAVMALCPNQVTDSINAILANCTYCDRAQIGIRVDQLESNGTWTTLYEKNSYSYLLPASNNKLFTTASAFLEFGLNYTITTPVYVNVDGDLCLVGRGDPSISNEDLLQLAATLSDAGITHVRNAYVDDTYYRGPFLPQNWEWSDIIQAYGASPAPLIVDENAFTINLYPGNVGDFVRGNFSYAVDATLYELFIGATTSEADVPANIVFGIEPGQYTKIGVSGTIPYGSGVNPYSLAVIAPEIRFAMLWAQALTSNKINVSGVASPYACYGGGSPGWKQVGAITSPSLLEMMNYTLQVSDNIYAETFLMHLGKTLPTEDNTTTRALGLEKANSILTASFGVENASFIQDDGSGVSRHNMASPDALITLIESIYFEKDGDIYLSFLPTAGKTGTLSDRFVNTTAEGILHAKTGTLEGVNCLTGFIDHQDSAHPVITFSILMNMGITSLIPPMDEICVLLSTVQNC